jgi:hypothetical protein
VAGRSAREVVSYARQVHGRTAPQQHRLRPLRQPRGTVLPSRLEAISDEHHPQRRLRTSARRRHVAVWPGCSLVDQLIADGQPPGPWPAGRRLAAGPAPGPKPPVTGPRRRAGDHLVLRGDDLPLPAEVIPASAVGAIWVYKQGSHVFTRALADITRYWQGIPFLAPEVVLLIKARPGTDKPGTDNDQRDFEAALPMLSAQQRSWLKDAIERPSWLKDAIEGNPRPPRQHRWTAELATGVHRPA